MSAGSAPIAGDGQPHRLPFGVLVVVVVRVIDALLVAGVGLGLRPLVVDLPAPLDEPRVLAAIGLTWAGLTVAGAIGLLLRKHWGWVLTMVMVGVGLTVNLVRVYLGVPDDLDLLLLVVSAFYLNQRAVRAATGPTAVRMAEAEP
jgi:hypothetical protein